MLKYLVAFKEVFPGTARLERYLAKPNMSANTATALRPQCYIAVTVLQVVPH